jgi:hypothetical protein
METRSGTLDADRFKGALEQDSRDQAGNTSMAGQLPHRDQDPLIKCFDSDFPEPGENPEHSCEPESENEHLQDLAPVK